jgi:signal peptidase I
VTKASLKFLFGVLAVCGAIAGVLRAFFVTPVMISDDGMAPTLLAGETVLMWNSKGATPEFGDLLVCRHPAARATWWGASSRGQAPPSRQTAAS